jgi:hypothetical protein
VDGGDVGRLELREEVGQQQALALHKTVVFQLSASFSLCLSRAWLGKKVTFIYEWLKKTVFRTAPSGPTMIIGS